MVFKKLYFIYIYIYFFEKSLKYGSILLKYERKYGDYGKYGSGGRPTKRIFPV